MLPNKLREGWEKTRKPSHRRWMCRLLGHFLNSSNAVTENSERGNILGFNGPVFMGLDQSSGRDKCDPQEQFQQSRFQGENLQENFFQVYLALAGLVPQHPSPIHLLLPRDPSAKRRVPEIEAEIEGEGRPKLDSPCSRCAYPGEYCTGHCTVINVWPCKGLSRVTLLQVHTDTHTHTPSYLTGLGHWDTAGLL